MKCVLELHFQLNFNGTNFSWLHIFLHVFNNADLVEGFLVAAPRQGICPARNASALSAALAVKALIIRLFIKCKTL